MDALLIVASFCMVVTLTNRNEIAQVRSAPSFQVIPVVYHGDGSTLKQGKIKRQEIRQQVRKAVRRAASGLRLWQAILLSILLGAALVFSGLGVIALSCSAACSGLDGLAVVILLAGGGLLTWLGILGYRAIWKEKERSGRKR
jgi:shikimate kinase